MISSTPAMTRRLRRLLPAALLAAIAALGGSALANPAAACAAPNTGEWDIGAYDRCVGTNPPKDFDKFIDHMHWCCINSGGEWNAAKKDCQAPPAKPAQAPPRWVYPGIDIQTATPVPPPPAARNPGVVTEPLTAAP